MPMAPPNAAGIELYYETHGDPGGVPLLFVMGLGAQYHLWDTELLDAFADRGFFAIRYDNRDVGLSTHVDTGDLDIGKNVVAAAFGEEAEVPYRLSDMADDAVSLLDHLGIGRAHVVGASMGGMIAQQLTIDHPDRVASLTSVMSSPDLLTHGTPEADVLLALIEDPGDEREAIIESSVKVSRLIAGPEMFDEGMARRRAELSYDRAHHPRGMGHHVLAIVASPSRTEALGGVTVPTLVVHGELDPLVTPEGGRQTAAAVPNAELLMVDGMGHDVPPVLWPRLIEAVIALVARAEQEAA